MSRNQKPAIDPVILIMIGIVFIAIAIGLAVVQSNPNSVDMANNSGTMSQLVVAFVTGLTTGGLSCLAVQGGLLASSLAHQIEQDYVAQVSQRKTHKKSKVQTPIPHCRSFFFWLRRLSLIHYLGGCLVCWVPILRSAQRRVPFS
jgi:hypothetical protein